jgi:hypothetical protein
MKAKEQQLDLLMKKAERKNRVRYTVKAILYSRSSLGRHRKWKHDNDVYYQVTARSFDVKAPRYSLKKSIESMP